MKDYLIEFHAQIEKVRNALKHGGLSIASKMSDKFPTELTKLYLSS